MAIGVAAYAYCQPREAGAPSGGPVDRLDDPKAAEKLIIAAAQKVLRQAGLKSQDLDLVIAHNTGSRFIMPGLGSAVHQGIEAPLEVPAYSLQTGPSSFIDACYLAKSLMEGDDRIQRVLVATVTAWHTGGWGAGPEGSWPTPQKDGAGAVIITRQSGKLDFLAYANETWGEVYDACVADFPPAPSGSGNKAEVQATPAYWAWLAEEAGQAMRRALVAALPQTGAAPSDLAAVISYQPSDHVLAAWKQALAAVGVGEDRWHVPSSAQGSAWAADMVLTLSQLAEAGTLKNGALLALVGPGMGGHCPVLIARWRT